MPHALDHLPCRPAYMERFRPLPPLLSPGGAFFMLCDRRAFLLCAVSRCKALQGVLTPHLYSYTPAHFTRLCEPVRAPWAIIACLSRFTLCCELAGDRRSGERDAGTLRPSADTLTRPQRGARRCRSFRGAGAWRPLVKANLFPLILVSRC